MPNAVNAGRRGKAQGRYVAIANRLIGAIARGRYPVGSLLPTEHDLCERFGISRFTVREALRQLTEAGLVTRRPRAGTVVVSRQRREPYVQTLASIGDLLQYSEDTELRMLRRGALDHAPAPPLPSGIGRAWAFGLGLRHRRGEERPVCITRVYLNPAFRAIVRRIGSRSGPVYKLIEERYGVQVARVEQRIDAASLSREDAALLAAKPGAPALRIVRAYYDAGGRLLEASDSLHPGERFSYAMTIRRRAA